MAYGWKDIVPSDQYCIRAGRPISPMELPYITHLYQPLIGSFSVSLYMTLYNEQMISGFNTPYGTHRGLMSIMNASLDDIIKARENLEAVGLLKTIKVQRERGETYYEYVLQPPMNPAAFFGDDMMSIILLNRVGKAKYRLLREKLVAKADETNPADERTEVTKRFDQVFASISPSELVVLPGSETEQFLSEMDARYPAGYLGLHPDQESKITFSHTGVDFAFLEASLPKSSGGSRTFSPELKEAIREMAFFYRLDDFQMAYFLQDPLIYDEQNEISIERLRSFVKDWYEKQYQGQMPRVVAKAGLEGENGATGLTAPKTPEEEHREALARLSPLALLEHYQGGGKVSPADVRIVEELSQNYQLSPGVINVLLEYVMLTNEKKLPRALIFKIATHWKRLGISKVEEAVELAKKLYHEAKDNRKPETQGWSKKTPPRRNLPVQRQDVLPEWVVKQIERGREQNIGTELNDEQKKQAEELLRALGEID